MKVILAAKSVYPFHPIGGVQKYVYYYAQYLSKEGVDVEIVAPLDEGRPRTEKKEGLTYTLLAPAIYSYLEYPIGWFGVHLFSSSLAKYLQGISFDLLHSFDMTGYQYLKVKDRNPVVSQIYTDNYLCNPIATWNFFNIFSLLGYNTKDIRQKKIKLSSSADGRMILKFPAQYFFKIKPMSFCLDESDAIFLEDEIFRKDVVDLFNINPGKGYVVPVGVDVAFINAQASKHVISRQEIGFKDDDLILITVNRLAADKGVDQVILALDLLKKEIPNVKLIIIGQGYQEKELLKIIAEKGLSPYIRHYKHIPEEKLYAFYKISDIYISAFSYPGSSLSTLEAMACSLPIITTAQPWLVEDNKNGFFLKNNDPQVIKEAVLNLVRQKALEFQGQGSREKIKEYDWQVIVRKAKKQYETILKEKVRI